MRALPPAVWEEMIYLLGWDGVLIDDVDLLGERVAIVVSGSTTSCDLEVSLSGVIAYRSNWKVGMRAASGFAAFAPRAVVLTRATGRSAYLRAAAAQTGVGVVAMVRGKPRVVCAPAPVSHRRRTIAHESVEAAVYARFAAHSAVCVH
jgi:hypothetical protein